MLGVLATNKVAMILVLCIKKYSIKVAFKPSAISSSFSESS
jgi:hypothetical protein